MNKAELINTIADRVDVSRAQAEAMVHALVDIITERLRAGEEVTIAGFGAWSAKKRAARMGVNPQNPSEKIRIPDVTVPKFKAGKGLKDALKSKPEAEKPAAPSTPPAAPAAPAPQTPPAAPSTPPPSTPPSPSTPQTPSGQPPSMPS